MATRALAVVLAVVAVLVVGSCAFFAAATSTEAGVGVHTTRAVAVPGDKPEPRLTCLDAGTRGARVYRLCTTRADGDPGTLYVGRSGSWELLAVAVPGGRRHAGHVIGHWTWARVSPDGRTLLLQWSAECEVPVAFFVSARGGRARPVTSERRHGAPPDSIALGWLKTGEARVAFPRGACGAHSRRPGVYAVSPRGGMRYLRPYEERRERRPRTIDEPA